MTHPTQDNQEAARTATIDTYDEHCPMLRIRFGPYELSFSVKDVAPEAWPWLGQVLERQVADLIRLNVDKALYDHKKALRELLGVKG